ncbi:hypothetical protein chiPu_0013736 [Chiloscyllium punctatum]|uniref:Uncharacterized protein n=1 Tax=Chiloscyllium punctatum TaxID=137246 RepID=A0A401SXZ1_CHIPU|nr:hypothetical protein [Chiloscyllium punctatum]
MEGARNGAQGRGSQANGAGKECVHQRQAGTHALFDGFKLPGAGLQVIEGGAWGGGKEVSISGAPPRMRRSPSPREGLAQDIGAGSMKLAPPLGSRDACAVWPS